MQVINEEWSETKVVKSGFWAAYYLKLGFKTSTDFSIARKDVFLSLAGTLNRSYKIGLLKASYHGTLIWNKSYKIRLLKHNTSFNWVSRAQLILEWPGKMFL